MIDSFSSSCAAPSCTEAEPAVLKSQLRHAYQLVVLPWLAYSLLTQDDNSYYFMFFFFHFVWTSSFQVSLLELHLELNKYCSMAERNEQSCWKPTMEAEAHCGASPWRDQPGWLTAGPYLEESWNDSLWAAQLLQPSSQSSQLPAFAAEFQMFFWCLHEMTAAVSTAKLSQVSSSHPSRPPTAIHSGLLLQLTQHKKTHSL